MEPEAQTFCTFAVVRSIVCFGAAHTEGCIYRTVVLNPVDMVRLHLGTLHIAVGRVTTGNTACISSHVTHANRTDQSKAYTIDHGHYNDHYA